MSIYIIYKIPEDRTSHRYIDKEDIICMEYIYDNNKNE